MAWVDLFSDVLRRKASSSIPKVAKISRETVQKAAEMLTPYKKK
jgi:hypothetical protein